jgi:hypothetical protein
MELTKAEVAMLKLAYSPSHLKWYKIFGYCCFVMAFILFAEAVLDFLNSVGVNREERLSRTVTTSFINMLFGAVFFNQYRAANLIRKLTENKTENKTS